MKIVGFILFAALLSMLLGVAVGVCFPQPKPPTVLTFLAVAPVTLFCVAAFGLGVWLVLR